MRIKKLLTFNKNYDIIIIEKMDKEYFIICYYNLYEKYKCGMFGDEEWKNIMTASSNY